MIEMLFKGTIYEVPDWSEYIAMDEQSGDIFVYDTEPYETANGNWSGGYSCRCEKVGNKNCAKIYKSDNDHAI
jgi:hypothetical protein